MFATFFREQEMIWKLCANGFNDGFFGSMIGFGHQVIDAFFVADLQTGSIEIMGELARTRIHRRVQRFFNHRAKLLHSQMLFSVIIVNYKVAPWLQQCLLTVRWAAAQVACEVIVVDNASDDESKLLMAQFPEVKFVWLEENKGFGKACNIGARAATGEWLLFLNPDTLVQPGLLRTMADFVAAHPKTGAMGVRMVDGAGRFLPESKRGMPYPLAVFFRLSGLSRLFPHNSVINHYYQGQLDPSAVWRVDILSGACMAVRRTVFEKLGGFDEAFFMYGEDIDLSWRIQQAGWENVYLPEPAVLHFKGESAAGALASNRHFYEAMVIFSKKHFGDRLKTLVWLQVGLAKMATAWRINKKKRSTVKKVSTAWLLRGEADAMASLAKRLPAGIQLVSTEAAADRLVVCISQGMALETFIAMGAAERRPSCFYVMGADYVTGSDDRRCGGELFRLK